MTSQKSKSKRAGDTQAFARATAVKVGCVGRSEGASSSARTCARYTTASASNRRAFLRVLASIPLWVAVRKSRAAGTVSEALVELKAAEGALDRLEVLADLSEYDALRQMLRSAPLNRIRAACSTLYRSMPDEKRRRQAEDAYKKLIRSVEDTDSKALRVSRGEIEADVGQLVQGVQKLFYDFSALVEE
ncbi:unnamed protein product [Agarophyton chilense]